MEGGLAEWPMEFVRGATQQDRPIKLVYRHFKRKLDDFFRV